MHTISNDKIRISVSEKGAELQSLFHLANKLEYLWGAHAEWPKKSPVLFPIIGELKNNTFTYKGKTYSLPRHGFARNHDFVLSGSGEDHLSFTLTSSNDTKEVYPFDFRFTIHYAIQDAGVSITYTVENTGDEEMYFSAGAHPAFAVPLVKELNFEDYYLQFEKKENAPRWPLNDEGLIVNDPANFLENTNKLPLQKDLFNKDALVFKDLTSTSISLVSDKSPHGLKVSFEGFSYMGIWSTKRADFVCIEPWCGIADHEHATGALPEKEGIIPLPPAQTWQRSFSIELF